MHVLQEPYRRFHDRLLNYDGARAFDDVVEPWLAANTDEALWLRDLRERAAPDQQMTREENWRLYGLSRMVDLLALSFSPRVFGRSDRWRPESVSVDQFVTTMTALGLEPIEETTFHPFHHEIAIARRDDALQHAEVTAVLWPGFMLGGLMISRAGCSVAGPHGRMDAGIATSSTLGLCKEQPACDGSKRGMG